MLVLLLTPKSHAQVPLFRETGPQVEDVVQGRLGSCFFHATIAALTLQNPAAMAKMIQPGLLPGSYKVTFPDGSVETAYEGDITYARRKQYDQSRALWVTVLFRAYGQRVLRDALRRAVDKTALSTFVKTPLIAVVDSTDVVVLAYDRTIRETIDQEGMVDALRLKDNLRGHLKPLPLSDSIKTRFVDLLDSAAFFGTIADSVKQNGEVFGAYRAIGNGGVPLLVLKAFLGKDSSIIHTYSANLRKALSLGVPTVAGTFLPPKQLPRGSENWFVERHAYTILRFDPKTETVVLRNPWANFPSPDGVLTLSLSDFQSAFYTLSLAASVAD